ncbi:MAG TPA: AzlC family ABC transporter permease [Pseudolabrys sp.]|nr:AzlC family ABC transporter permease [Pseudolabrys sp.]
MSQPFSTPPPESFVRTFPSAPSAFFHGILGALSSMFFLVIGGTYIGMGALAHDFNLGAWWLAVSTVLVWAGPAQVILISALGTGAAPIEVAVAVAMSGIRLFPMVVALMPVLRRPNMRLRDMILPTHFTSVSMWVESMRLLPSMPRESRVAFSNGLSVGFMGTATIGGFIGYYLAGGLPPLFAAALLFITPLSFLISTARNARMFMDKLALVIGLVLGSLLTAMQVELDLLWTGIGGGTLAYLIHRLREARAEPQV